MELLIEHEIPDTNNREVVGGCKSFIAMMSRYEDNETIMIHYSLTSYIIDEPEIVYSLPKPVDNFVPTPTNASLEKADNNHSLNGTKIGH